MNEIAECLSELAFQKRSITQYQEMNSCLGEELIERNCPQLAKEKQILAQVETLLAKRLDSLFFTGPPYRTFSTSWKDILQSQQHNSAPQSPEIPQEDDRLSHSPRDYDSDSMVQSPGSEESDDELSSRTKALVRSTQETLIAFDSSESSGNSLSSPSPSSHDLRRTSSEISPHPAHKRYVNAACEVDHINYVLTLFMIESEMKIAGPYPSGGDRIHSMKHCLQNNRSRPSPSG